MIGIFISMYSAESALGNILFPSGSRKLRGIRDTPEPSISFENLQAPILRTLSS